MKKLFNLVPVALAALALASCSSDDLNIANGENELTFSPDQLMVQIEGDESEGTTRGGYVTNIYNYNLYSAMAFDLGETLKLYHDATSWKPEIWTADAYGQYKNATGTAVFKKADATITAEENAYGIYPSTASVFGNEDRTSIQYDLSDLAFVDYSVDATKEYGGTTGEGAVTKYYQAKFPLWGVKAAGAQVMTMKHLAGILRLDIADITDNGAYPLPAAANNYKYIVIYSGAKKLTGKINTAADLLNPAAADALTPGTFMTTTPKLEAVAPTAAAALDAIPLTKAGAEAADNVIVIRIDNTTTDKHVFAFVPVLPTTAAGEVEVFVTNVLPGATANIDLTDAANYNQHYTLDATVINDCNKAYKAGAAYPYADQITVQRGVTYKINDDSSNKNTTAKTPFQLAEGIIAADKAAYRDFEVTFTQPIEVKNNDDSPQNFLLNLAGGEDRYGLADGWALKHNVTVNLQLKESDDAGAVPSVLYIRTKEGSKKLTLNITNDANPVDRIEIEEGKLKSELVFKREAVGKALPNITVKKGNDDLVTIKSGNNVAGSGNLITGSNLAIEIGAYNAADRIKSLTLTSGVSQVNIKKASIANINISGADKIDQDVIINTEDKVGINVVEYNNMPNVAGTAAGQRVDSKNLIFKSKWVEGTAASSAPATFTTTIIRDGATTINNCITTAAQLASMQGVPATDYTVVGEYDLDGTKSTWTSQAGLTGFVKGAQYFRFSDAAARAITGFATIKNLKGVNGLIATWAPAAIAPGDPIKEISNITFDGVNQVKGAAAANAIGLLAGSVNSANIGVIKNIKVQGTSTIEGQTTGAGIGGIIGKTEGASNLILANNSVASETTVKGFKYVGGIVGEVAGKVIFAAAPANVETNAAAVLKTDAAAAYANTDKYNSSAATLETFRISTTAPASENLPTKGQFFGGASALAVDGDVTILGALTKVDAGFTDATWGYYLSDANKESWVWPATLYYNEIGLCGYDVDGVYATGFTVIKKVGFASITNLTENAITHKYGTSTALTTSVAKTAPVDGTPANTKYFSWVKNPQP